MQELSVQPVKKINAVLNVPGDKSISHRAVMLAGFASGTTRVTNFLPSDDCLCSLRAMQALGAQVERLDETTLEITGCNGTFLPPRESIDCGNSGTSIRLLAGLVAGQPFRTHFHGDASLSSRPMKRIVEPLTQMGARVECEGPNFRPPLTVHGGPLTAITYSTPVASAQLKSCILLAGLQAEGKTTVIESSPSRDHTERMLQHFHGSIQRVGLQTSVFGKNGLHAEDIHVPGDFSSAAFWLVAASAFPNGSITLPNVGLNPTRTGLIRVLLRMGALIHETVESTGCEPAGTLIVEKGGHLKPTSVGGDEIPNIIDELPILAIAFALAKGVSEIRDAAELRVKETDRIAAVATNLRKFGVPVEERPDGLIIEGGQPITGATVESFGDHRIAMAFAILGLFAQGTTRVLNTGCVATSYPTFPDHLRQILKPPIQPRNLR